MLGDVPFVGGAVDALTGGGATNTIGGGGGAAAFDSALTSAQTAAGGQDAQLVNKMTEAGVNVMGNLMMQIAGDILQEGSSEE